MFVRLISVKSTVAEYFNHCNKLTVVSVFQRAINTKHTIQFDVNQVLASISKQTFQLFA